VFSGNIRLVFTVALSTTRSTPGALGEAWITFTLAVAEASGAAVGELSSSLQPVRENVRAVPTKRRPRDLNFFMMFLLCIGVVGLNALRDPITQRESR
jgi:hypothetical protein